MALSAVSLMQREVAQINITPLVDVMLVLLVIFMITAPVLETPIAMDVPGKAPPIITNPPPEPILLRVDTGDVIVWDGESVPRRALQTRLQLALQGSGERQPMLQIDASDQADYGTVAGVLAAARNAGVRDIGFVHR